LIVDGSSFTRNRLRETLLNFGYQVEEARNGNEALSKIETGPCACVVTDLHMPDLDGFQLLERMTERTSAPPAIVLSADIQKGSRERCQRLGAKAFLNKPPRVDELISAIETVLNRVCLTSR
jgi:twitching motility two-component system response regulator PilH